eukprot:CAMPEP_0197073944 /NCGR_PEP_ID=MMETSP1384-20130603/210861_1 /TAXON_ID=29189 /ORGANISM="Ammonia sp." /LENGTH=399 /DNA_ID=CAMNT_0042512785 /DNA_START=9 /DNA_END=1208 /DNA_ORIENTATION=+
MALQETPTSVELERLRQRQEATLSKLGALQLRLGELQRQQNIPYDTSNVSQRQFTALQSKQASIFSRLLNIAGQLDDIAQKQNIQLPASNEVASVICGMSESLQQRQQRSLTQLRLLQNIANSIQSVPISPKVHQLLAKQDEKEQEEKKEAASQRQTSSFDRSKSESYKSRKYDLELIAECLRTQCQRMDSNSTGKVTKQQLLNLLADVQLAEVARSVQNEKHIKLIMDEITRDTIIDYNTFLNLLTDFSATDGMAAGKVEWNLFRFNLIGAGRVEGKLRIFYRYDGWPEPVSFVVNDVNTAHRLNLPLTEVLQYIEKKTKKAVPYKEIRYALHPTFVPGKRGWEKLNAENLEKAKVPFLIHNDGTLEIDIWLRTQDFIANKHGMPLPEENEEDLVDID